MGLNKWDFRYVVDAKRISQEKTDLLKENEKDKWDRTEIVTLRGANRRNTGLESGKSKLRKKMS